MYNRRMKKALLFCISLLVVASFFVVTAPSAKAYTNNNLIDDAVFDNTNTLDTAGIQNFLNQFPNSCLKNYSAVYPNSYFSYGGAVSAATVIRRVADLWGINPQVILTKLEQEESLVRGNAGCPEWRYNSAMGMGCPDGGACPAPGYEGFSKQVTKGAWQLKWSKEAAVGNVNWQGNGDLTYGGKMTQGNRQRCNTCQTVYYDGYYTMDGVLTHMDNGATASLYTYTPHVPSSFPVLFETFFGSGSTSAYTPGAVYRAYRASNNEHLYSASPGEIEAAKKLGFTYEGPAWPNSSAPGAAPVYRLYSPRSNRHFYTNSVAERDYIAANLGYINEGPSWAALTTPTLGAVTVYRAYRRSDDKHLFTASWQELNNSGSLGFVYEGIAWYSK